MNKLVELKATKLLALSGRLFIPDIPVLEYCNRLWIPSSPYLLRSILTNKDRLCERSEPQSYPVVGRARQ